MVKSQVVAHLAERRANLTEELTRLRERVETLALDIAHLDGAILLFDPTYALSDIRRKGPSLNNPWFAHGEASRFVLDALREASGPMSTRQLGEITAVRKGAEPKDADEWDRLLKSVHGALQRLERRSIVRMVRGDVVGRRNVILWQLV